MSSVAGAVGQGDGRQVPSKLRKIYMARLAARCIVFAGCIAIYITNPDMLKILEGWNFFRGFSVFHLLWLVWMIDMFYQLVPVSKKISLGSHKLFRLRFRPIQEKINYPALKNYIVSTTKAAYKVFLLWVALIAAIEGLLFTEIIDKAIVFLITVCFYVCDLICVLIWCPFRLIVKTRCCTTCRIFNWDHLMMFSPMIVIGGFYAWSLIAAAMIVWVVWELGVLVYPERFWEFSNEALKCSNCTDKLCTQYCQKLRR